MVFAKDPILILVIEKIMNSFYKQIKSIDYDNQFNSNINERKKILNKEDDKNSKF